MNPYRCVLVALLSTASVGLAQAPHAAIITGEVHNAPSRDIEFRHEPLLAPGPSEHYIVLDEQKPLCPALEHSQGSFGQWVLQRRGILPLICRTRRQPACGRNL